MANYGNLIIIGAGGYGQVVKEIAEESGEFNRIKFLDDHHPSAVGKIAEAEKFLRDFPYAIIAIGNPEMRAKFFIELEHVGFRLINIISNRNYVADSAKIGKGCVIEPNVTVSTNSKIGNGVFLCAGSVVGHNSVVHDFCQIDYNAVVHVGAEVTPQTRVLAGTVYRK